MDPYFPILSSVWGHNDRDAINMNLILRFITSYEPYQFKGNVGDFPLTLSYGKKADALREKYRSYLLGRGIPRHTGGQRYNGRRIITLPIRRI